MCLMRITPKNYRDLDLIRKIITCHYVPKPVTPRSDCESQSECRATSGAQISKH